MRKDFDFGEIGKHTPYLIPERNFEEMQHYVWKKVEAQKAARKRMKRIFVSCFSAAAAIILLVLVSYPLPEDGQRNKSEELFANNNWVYNMSDEDLQTLETIYDCDIFMN